MSPERDPATDSAALFAEAVSIMARLRGPDGCPWDREQTFDTIRKYTLEESYEVFDAIERRDWNDLCEELGDLLLQVLFYAQMASESRLLHHRGCDCRSQPQADPPPPSCFRGRGLGGRRQRGAIRARDRGYRRRPGAAQLGSDQAGRKERNRSRFLGARNHSALPSLATGSCQVGYRARKSGFDWPDVEGIFAKLEEETEELRQAIDQHPPPASRAPRKTSFPKSATCCLPWSTWPGGSTWNRSSPCATPTPSFAAVLPPWKPLLHNPSRALSAAQLESLWSQAKLRRKPAPPAR